MKEAPGRVTPARILATDLDGTLIPLVGNEQNQRDLVTLGRGLRKQGIPLVFVTGRHLELVQAALDEHRLPPPDWVVCDVGTTIYTRDQQGQLSKLEAYRQHLTQITAEFPIPQMIDALDDVSDLQLQEAEKQGEFKLSYYTSGSRVAALAQQVRQCVDRHQAPYSVIDSTDPFTGDGLIDLLPRDVSKAFALRWWSDYRGLPTEQVVFAGDSGNDLAALLAGYRCILVGNADRALAARVWREHRERGWRNRLFLALDDATSGVLAGCRWFELLSPGAAPSASADASYGLGPPPISPRWTTEPVLANLGALPCTAHRTQFRVWAPQCRNVAVQVRSDGRRTEHALQREPGGYFGGVVRGVSPGARYRFRLDEGRSRPDPASRYQPGSVHGWSQVVAPGQFPWRDGDWRGLELEKLLIYELHVGTFTEEGTFAAAGERLGELVDLGVTAVELMPICQSAGRWNWGYDGVDLFAVRNSYGTPDDLRQFVDRCHELGLGVIVDVVYNHLGPEGNYLAEFGPYFSRRHGTAWGPALNYDGEQAGPVREFIIANALYWLAEYRVDGLRLDAVHCMHDESEPSILHELSDAVRQLAERTRRPRLLIGETNVYEPDLIDARRLPGPVFDAIWCDDFLHSLLTIAACDRKLTHREYRGAADLAETLRHGHVYQSYPYRRIAEHDRGEPADVNRLVTAIQNHDAIGNHPLGHRLHRTTSPSFQRAAATLMILYPAIPLLFMGEEFAAAAPFHFFADFTDERVRQAIVQGRAREYPQHEWHDAVNPLDEQAFHASKPGRTAEGDTGMRGWYQALIRLRRQWRTAGLLERRYLAVAVDLPSNLFILRYAAAGRTPVFVAARICGPQQTPGSAPHLQTRGRVCLHSEDRAWGGTGNTPTQTDPLLRLLPNQAFVGEGDCAVQGR